VNCAVSVHFFGFFGALKKGEFFGLRPKKVGRGGWRRTEGSNQASLPPLVTPSPLAPCGRGAGGEGEGHRQRSRVATRKPMDFFWVHAKKVRPPRGFASAPQWRNSSSPPAARRNFHFATQSIPKKSFVATSPRLRCWNKLKRILIGIWMHLAILGLGRNSGASGDFHLTRPSQRSRKFFPGRNLTFAESTGGVGNSSA